MKSKQIACPVHGSVLIEEQLILDLVETREFNRLRRVSQLGLTNLIYPSATHDRYTHSLGVYHTAKQMINASGIQLDEKNELALLAASLLHDIGHGPYSHLFEMVSPISHEEYSTMLVNDEASEINKVLKSYSDDMPDIVSSIISKTHRIPAVNQILSSEVDADRIDYLNRDSLFTGNSRVSVNLDWLFKNLVIVDNNIAFNHKAIFEIENFILGRYHMYQTVYLNSKNIIFQEIYAIFLKEYIKDIESDSLINSALKSTEEGRRMTYEEFMSLDDSVVETIILNANRNGSDRLKRLSSFMLEGKLPPHKVFNNKEEAEIFVSENNWKLIKVDVDFKKYGANVSEQARIVTDDGVKAISEVSTIIRSTNDKTDESKNKYIGIEI